jgi:hypothetical protein
MSAFSAVQPAFRPLRGSRRKYYDPGLSCCIEPIFVGVGKCDNLGLEQSFGESTQGSDSQNKTRLRYAPAYGAETKVVVDLSKIKEVPEADY